MTNFAEIAHVSSVSAAAHLYADLGLSIVPVNGKRAAVAWSQFQRRKPTRAEIHWWDQRGLLGGVGVVCGQVSRNLVVVDLDGLNAVTTFERLFPQLTATFTVLTGSGRGKHLYFWLEQLPGTLRAMNIPGGGNIELRANGCYVVAAPSLHPDTGSPYAVACPYEPMFLRSFSSVETWLHRLAGRVHQHEPALPQTNNLRAMRDSYARTALEGEIGAVKATSEGKRNDRLNRAAYSLGQLVGDGLLERTQIETHLLAAALSVGQSEREAQATIKSGIEAGMKNPRSYRGRRNG